MTRRLLLHLAVLAAVGAAYFAAGKLGLSHALINESASAIWPPTGLAIAAILLLGYRVWPAIALGSLLVNLTTTGALLPTLGIVAGNTAEALLGAWLARTFAGGRDAFQSAENIVRYVFFAALPSTALAATVGVTTLWAVGRVEPIWYAPVWLTWWTGDFVSSVTVAPLLLIWLGRPLPVLGLSRSLEAALLVAAICAVGAYLFAGGLHGPVNHYPLSYLTVPLLLWAAYRFHQHGAIAAAGLTTAIAIWGTSGGHGLFAVADPNHALLLLQAFVGVATLTALLLAAAVAGRGSAEHALREHQQHMLIALDSGRMGTWQWDLASNRVTWSPRLEEIHGLAPGTFAGTFDAFLADVHPEDAEHVRGTIGRTLERLDDHQMEYRLKLADGAVRWVEGRGRFVLDSSGRPVRLVGVCMDVTERKNAEAERERLLAAEREARADAERANRTKDEFLAILSHELRTPLTPVLLTTSLLEQTAELPEALRGDVETIRRNVALEARLIDDLLDVTRITHGKLELDLEPSDAHGIIRRAIAICCPSGDARQRLHVDLAARRAVVQADPARLQQVFWNLLSNAVKFTPPGKRITVRSRNEGDRLVVEIEDEGRGIEPDLLPRLFLAFEQGRNNGEGGLGLGLTISHALVSAHGGTLGVQSEGSGRGSRFTVSLPTTATTRAGDAGSPDEATPGAAAPATSGEGLRILLVEDHASTREILMKLLSRAGHRVTCAGSVAEALACLGLDRTPTSEGENGSRFDLLVSDLGLPDGLAYGLMEQARRLGIPGIALSGYGMEADIERSRAAGFREHLTKPIDFSTLATAIDRVARDDAATARSGALTG